MIFSVTTLVFVNTLSSLGTVPVKADGDNASPFYLSPRTFLTNPRDHWPRTKDGDGNTLVIIPYVIDNLDTRLKPLIYRYMEEFANKSCIRYVEATGEEDVKVYFTSMPPDNARDPERFCYSTIGYMGQYYDHVIHLSVLGCLLDPDDEYYPMVTNIPHEMMHNLGFIHEHARRDRDCYVTVADEVLEDEDYAIYKWKIHDVTFPYDEKSIMQYPETPQLQSKLGERLGPEGDSLDPQDWLRLNYVYCGGPHVCDLDPGLCERHRQIRLAGGCVME